MRWLPEIRQIMSTVMAVPPDGIQPGTVPNDVAAWDSVTHLYLVIALEDELDIRLSPGEIERMTSVGEICGIVAEKRGA
ncbi:MAG: acyl carrier protein [Acetobacteraceae bacterium]